MANALLETDTAIDPHSYGARWARRQEKIDFAYARKDAYEAELKQAINAEKAASMPDLEKIAELEEMLKITECFYYD